MTTIYLSSTYEDLKEYREAVYKALHKSGYNVIAMEDYVAADQRPVDRCLQDVANSDIYVGIFALRYGYVPPASHNNPNALSITELEYRHAENLKKPRLVFVLDENTKWMPKFVEKGDRIVELRKRLLTERMANSFQEPDELATLVQAAITREMAKQEVASANTGIRLLKELIIKVPAVADAVGRSKEAIENTYRQVDKLDLFKKIHDAFHSIEFDCLRPMQAGGIGSVLPFKIAFEKQAHRISDYLKREINPVLRDDILDRLETTAKAFKEAICAQSEANYACVVSELKGLVSGLPSRLDSSIAEAAEELKLDHLVEIIGTVQAQLEGSVSTQDTELEPFVASMKALRGLRDELARRVWEHGQLQGLDSKLRAVCEGGAIPVTMKTEWDRIMRARSKLKPPFLVEPSVVYDDLAIIEAEINAEIASGDENAVRDRMRDYFSVVSYVFRDADGSLKDFCMELSKISQPLRTVLSMC